MKKLLSILLVEDDVIEVMKFNSIVSSLNFGCKIEEAYNGAEAINILETTNRLPDLILLDLNMPILNGKELLNILKNHITLKHIPRVVLTTSSNEKDLIDCYKMGISGYLIKPLKYEDYVSKISKTLSYWRESEFLST